MRRFDSDPRLQNISQENPLKMRVFYWLSVSLVDVCLPYICNSCGGLLITEQ